MGTSYYDDDAKQALEAVQEATSEYEKLKGELLTRNGEDASGSLARSMGMKMEQLRQELDLLLEDDHH